MTKPERARLAEDVLLMVVRPTLADMHKLVPGLHSLSAEKLLMGTAAKESEFVSLRQRAWPDGRRGPALGLTQIEPATHKDLWLNYLRYEKQLPLQRALMRLVGLGLIQSLELPEPENIGKAMVVPADAQLAMNSMYAFGATRANYRRVPEPLPDGLAPPKEYAKYWKDHHNTPAGAGTEAGFLTSWELFGLDRLWG